MLLLPDVAALYRAADAVDATAARVDADMAAVSRTVEGLLWYGPRRDVVIGAVAAATWPGRQQASAERDLARALRQLARETEAELRVLAELAARARGHLEDLLRRARAVVDVTASAVGELASRVGATVVEVLTFDPVAALREARALAEQAVERLRTITVRLNSLPAPHDPRWRRLGPEILGWRPL